MNSLLQSEIFFFIASVATIIITVLIALILWHISRVAKNIHLTSDAIQKEFSTLVGHVADVRESIIHAVESIITTINKKSSIKK